MNKCKQIAPLEERVADLERRTRRLRQWRREVIRANQLAANLTRERERDRTGERVPERGDW